MPPSAPAAPAAPAPQSTNIAPSLASVQLGKEQYQTKGVTVRYLWIKCTVLTIYYAILSHFQLLSFRARLIAFCLVAPANRVITQALYTEPSKRMSLKRSVFTVVGEISEACIHVYLQTHFIRGYWWLSLILQVSVSILAEVVQYALFDRKTSKYDVKMPTEPLDNLLTVVISGTLHWLSMRITFSSFLTAYSFPLFATSLYIFDLAFGVFHSYSHCIPWMHKKHMVHHQYRKNDLNAFANFYADIIDSFIMNIGFFFVAAYLAVMRGGHVQMAEITYAGMHTHVRYATSQCHLVFFFEYDMIDLWFKRDRISTFHAKYII
eukprot:1395358-Amorphochlora_amoeboformis.AAC.1